MPQSNNPHICDNFSSWYAQRRWSLVLHTNQVNACALQATVPIPVSVQVAFPLWPRTLCCKQLRQSPPLQRCKELPFLIFFGGHFIVLKLIIKLIYILRKNLEVPSFRRKVFSRHDEEGSQAPVARWALESANLHDGSLLAKNIISNEPRELIIKTLF